MDSIFHETQEGSLCAQHCLNSLVQGPYFTAVDLGNIARDLDEEERQRMAEGDVESEEYQKFLREPSHNVDDSGFFSVQVLSQALAVWNLQLIPYNSQEAQTARENPLTEKAFICNLQEHWLAVRKLGRQWFNLNSLLSGPELLSNTYLGLFLAQLQNEGYSIFVVRGDLPPCEADTVLSVTEAVQTVQPYVLGGDDDDDDDEGLDRSSRRRHRRAREELDVENDAALKKAIELSLLKDGDDGANQAYKEKDEEEEAELRKAIALSLETPLTPKDESKETSPELLSPKAVSDALEAAVRSVSSPTALDDAYVVHSLSGDSDNNDDDVLSAEETKDDEGVVSVSRITRQVSEMTEEEMMEMALKLSQDPQ
ncbi:ataxin-3-like [Oscarella lobularis]|uniref:ataxin-3-like n=1 Tax=Oscarella lobularis TaxID=121494 RepID=UPI0033143F26